MEMMNWKLIILLFGVSTSVLAVEDPANCDLVNGGLGNTSSGAMAFFLSQAHVGDTVSVQPRFGMVVGACSADNVTGSVYIATGFLTNFMINAHLDPTNAVTCPGGSACTPGPYSFTITAPMVGAGVTSPNGSIAGAAKSVRTVENADGNVNTIAGATVADFHSATISIKTPCIQVFKTGGISCTGSNANFTGYVTNCGDITLTNVTVVDDRTASLFNMDGSALSQPLTLTNGQAIYFKGEFAPYTNETSTATNTLTAWGTDTTTIGGPNASVTNSVTALCYITSCTNCQCPYLILDAPVKRGRRYAIK